jgi:hypothetical protein
MPALAEHSSSKFFKFIYIGDSSTGKTGSLTSLVAAGYRLRVLDLDNGLDSLKAFVGKECPDKIGAVDFETSVDQYRASISGPMIVGSKPQAFTKALKLMTEWSDGSKPQEWGENTIFVLDSMSAYGRAALAWAKGMNPAAKDPRQWYFTAQQAVEDTVQMLTSADFQTNVIVISHINYKEVREGETKGYVNVVGTALGPIIPRYFNTIVMASKIGSGKFIKRSIVTASTPEVDLKNPVSFKLGETLPLETGLATVVASLRAG